MKQDLKELGAILAEIGDGHEWQFSTASRPDVWHEPDCEFEPLRAIQLGNRIRLKPAPDPYSELKAAHAAGKAIQYKCPDSMGAWTDVKNPRWDGVPEFYRVKPDPVPLAPEDVPPGSVMRNLRFYSKTAWVNFTSVNFNGIVAGDILYGYDRLMQDGWEIQCPGQDWQPCSKPAP